MFRKIKSLIKNNIKYSKIGDEIRVEEWIKAISQLQNTLLIIDEDNALIRNNNFEVPKGKTAILVRGNNTLLENNHIFFGNEGIRIEGINNG